MDFSEDQQSCMTPGVRRPNMADDLQLMNRSLSEGPLHLADETLSMSEKLAASESFKPMFKGMLELIIGPMFAGKSTELLRRVKRHSISGKSCLYVKYAADTRYDTSCIATHDLLKESAQAVTTLAELGDTWKQYDVIGIDEGQFYSDVVQFCENASQNGKIVIVSALGGTYQREGFNDILDLVPKAEKIKQLHAICRLCYHQASFTLRTTTDDSVELIGGTETYMPVCRECFLYQTQEQELKQVGSKAAAKNSIETTQVVLSGEDEKVDDDASKLIVSVQKSQSHGTTSTQTNSGDKSETTEERGAAAAGHKVTAVPYSDADEPESLLLRNE